MLDKRILSAAVIIPVCLLAVFLGGWFFLLLVSLILGVAAWELARMFRQGGFSPDNFILVVGSILLAVARFFTQTDLTPMIFTVLVLLGMAFHTIAYERGVDSAGVDFCLTTGGLAYVGWLGSHLVSLRMLPEGTYWIILAIVSVSMADVGAYLVGMVLGRHKISRLVSPNKSVEGYLGGIVMAVLFAYVFSMAIQPHSDTIQPTNGVMLGLILSLVSPLGDLGESMLKRQFKLKDSSQLIPGHGGFLDRIDTWIWAAAVGYYLITWLWI